MKTLWEVKIWLRKCVCDFNIILAIESSKNMSWTYMFMDQFRSKLSKVMEESYKRLIEY
jgi:hypothetical protein